MLQSQASDLAVIGDTNVAKVQASAIVQSFLTTILAYCTFSFGVNILLAFDIAHHPPQLFVRSMRINSPTRLVYPHRVTS